MQTVVTSIALGQSMAGLTLEARLFDADGVSLGAAVTTGFSDRTKGAYTWKHDFSDAFQGWADFWEVGGDFTGATAEYNLGDTNQAEHDATQALIVALQGDFDSFEITNQSEHDATQSLIAALELHGDAEWATATGFETEVAAAARAAADQAEHDATQAQIDALQAHGDAAWATATGAAGGGQVIEVVDGAAQIVEIQVTNQIVEVVP